MADDDQELKKEIAVNDRMCPCVARRSMIAICPCVARWSMIAIETDLYASVVIRAVPQATFVFHSHTAWHGMAWHITARQRVAYLSIA